MRIRMLLIVVLLIFSIGCPTISDGQSRMIAFEEVIDSSDVIVIAKVTTYTTLSRLTIDSLSTSGQYGINTKYGGEIYFAEVERVIKGQGVKSVLNIITIFYETMTTE